MKRQAIIWIVAIALGWFLGPVLAGAFSPHPVYDFTGVQAVLQELRETGQVAPYHMHLAAPQDIGD